MNIREIHEEKIQYVRSQLDAIFDQLKTITTATPTLAELKFPSQEIWRFFVEEDRQNKGNTLLKKINSEIKNLKEINEKAKQEQLQLEEELKQYKEGTKEYEILVNRIKSLSINLSLAQEISFIETILEMQLIVAKKEVISIFNKINEGKITPSHPLHSLYKDVIFSFSYAEATCKELPELLSENLKTLLVYSNGWLQFEATEPGCVSAFVKACYPWNNAKPFMKDAKNFVKEHIHLIKTFHGDSTIGVSGKLLTKEKDSKEIRQNSHYEFKSIDIASFFPILIKNNSSELYTASPEGLQESIKRWGELMAKFSCYKIKLTKKNNGIGIRSFINGENKKEIEENIEKIVSFLLEEYFIKMNETKEPILKLIHIIHLIRDLEQLHPFNDANCRTLCVLYCNYLLITNGFPPAMLPNANHFDAFSTLELLEDLIEGMRRTLAMSQGIKELAGICTNDIRLFLASNEKYQKELAYAVQYVLKFPEIPTPDQYLEAINILDEYIIMNSWDVPYRGGAEIKIEESKTIKVPTCVLEQWNVINRDDKNPQEKYRKIIEIAVSTYKAEENLSSVRKFFEGRNERTTQYLKHFYLGMFPDDMIKIFAPSVLSLKKSGHKR